MKVLSILALILIIATGSGTVLQAQQTQASLEKGGHRGKVISTMNSGGYTYIQLEENGKKLWVACRQFEVSVGDLILVTGKIAYKKNFGAGYIFPVIIEDASVKIEQTTKPK
jgi:hypothetical protein